MTEQIFTLLTVASLVFRTPYEVYIKHYPLSEAHHRKELRRNTKYQSFLSQCSQDPRVRKRDLITFLSRPVTRLPRLSLLLETAYKCTAPDHPDQESLPLILSILSEFIKSTQPGIEAAEGKVKFWALCESLSYQKGEIIVRFLYTGLCLVNIQFGIFVRIWTFTTKVGRYFMLVRLLDDTVPKLAIIGQIYTWHYWTTIVRTS